MKVDDNNSWSLFFLFVFLFSTATFLTHFSSGLQRLDPFQLSLRLNPLDMSSFRGMFVRLHCVFSFLTHFFGCSSTSDPVYQI